MRLFLTGAIAVMGACSGAATGDNEAAASSAPGVTHAAPNAASANALPANDSQMSAPALSGSQADQVAQLLVALIRLDRGADWDTVRSLVPGARWEPLRETDPGVTFLAGEVSLAGVGYSLSVMRRDQRIFEMDLGSESGSPLVSPSALRRALAAHGVSLERLHCVGSMMQYVRLTDGPRSEVMLLSINAGSRAEPSDIYTFQADPEVPDGPGEDVCEG